MSRSRVKLSQLRRIQGFGGEALKCSFIRQPLTRTAGKCSISSIRSEGRTTYAACAPSPFQPMNTEACKPKCRDTDFICKQKKRLSIMISLRNDSLSHFVSRMNDTRPDFSSRDGSADKNVPKCFAVKREKRPKVRCPQ